MEQQTVGQEKQEQQRELHEAYLAIRHNACWQWLLAELARSRAYAYQRIVAADDWDDFCYQRGRLESVSALSDQVEELINHREDEIDEF